MQKFFENIFLQEQALMGIYMGRLQGITRPKQMQISLHGNVNK